MPGKLVALLFLLTMACGSGDSRGGAVADGQLVVSQPQDAVWTQETAWQVSSVPVVQIKGSDEIVEEAPLDPVRAFRLADGRYVVGDGDQNGWHALMVYDRKGKFRAMIGGEGAGPGEFRQLFLWAGSYRGDSIAAYDFVDRGLEIFSGDGKFGRSLKLPNPIPTSRPPRGTSWATDFFIGPFGDGSLLRFETSTLDVSAGVGPVCHQPDLMIYDVDGRNPKKLGKFRTWCYWWDGQKAQQYIYQPMGITSVGRDTWYHGTAEDFTVHVMDRQGHELRVLKRPFHREPVTSADRESYIELYLQRVKASREKTVPAARIEQQLRNEARYGEYKPAFSSIVEDDGGNVWIEHFRWVEGYEVAPTPRPSRWSVFGREGKFLGDMQMPASFLVSSITNDQVIGFFKDEFDVEHLRVYGLIKP